MNASFHWPVTHVWPAWVRTGCFCCPCPQAAPGQRAFLIFLGRPLELSQGSYLEAPSCLKGEWTWTRREVRPRKTHTTPHPFSPSLLPPFFPVPFLSYSSSLYLSDPTSLWHAPSAHYLQNSAFVPPEVSLMPFTLDAPSRRERGRMLYS